MATRTQIWTACKQTIHLQGNTQKIEQKHFPMFIYIVKVADFKENLKTNFSAKFRWSPTLTHLSPL